MHLDFEIVQNTHSFQQISEPHFHDGYEVLLCLSDGGKFHIQDNVYPLHRKVMFVMPPNILHRCIVDIAEYERYIVHFSSDTLWMLSSAQTDLRKVFDESNYYTALSDEDFGQIERLMSLCRTEKTDFGNDLQRNIAFMQLVLEISRILREGEQVYAPCPSREFMRIMPLMEYIHKHYAEDITLDKLSQEFYMSKYYLCHRFKELTGFSVGEYLVNYRIRQACALLRNGASVQAAGEQVGFRNNAHFIRSFGRIIGMSPGKYSKAV